MCVCAVVSVRVRLRLRSVRARAAVCFLEDPGAGGVQSARVIDYTRKCARKVFPDVPDDAIFLWQYRGGSLTPTHMLYLLNDISKAIA